MAARAWNDRPLTPVTVRRISWCRLKGGRVIRSARLAGIGVLALVATVAVAYLLLPFAAAAIVRALTLTLDGVISLAAAIGSGEDAWTVLRTVARAGVGTLVSPEATGGIAALVCVA